MKFQRPQRQYKVRDGGKKCCRELIQKHCLVTDVVRVLTDSSVSPRPRDTTVPARFFRKYWVQKFPCLGRIWNTQKNTGNRFRSCDLGVMSPARCRCAMPVLAHFIVTLSDIRTTWFASKVLHFFIAASSDISRNGTNSFFNKAQKRKFQFSNSNILEDNWKQVLAGTRRDLGCPWLSSWTMLCFSSLPGASLLLPSVLSSTAPVLHLQWTLRFTHLKDLPIWLHLFWPAWWSKGVSLEAHWIWDTSTQQQL